MDKYDCYITDKQMSKKINEIYSDPKRHRFYSYHDYIKDNNILDVYGTKNRCFYCGGKKDGHAKETEQV